MSPFRNALFLILLTICLAPAPRAALAAGSDQDRIDALEKIGRASCRERVYVLV